MLGEQVKSTLHAREHAQRQAVDLHEAQGVDIVLVPFDDLPVGHGRRLDRHEFVQPVVCQHETARMLGKMSRRARQFAGEFERQPETAVGGVEVQLLDMLGVCPSSGFLGQQAA